MLVQCLNLFAIPLAIAHWRLGLEHLLDSQQDFFLFLVGLEIFTRNYAVKLRDSLVDMLQILLEELVSNDLHVAHGVYFTFIVHHIIARETSHNVVNSINSLNVRQKGISKTFTF